MFDELFKTWDKNKVLTIVGLIKELDCSPPNIIPHVFMAVDSFMQGMNVRTKQVIDSIYEQNEKPW
jgi:hypothetical protein